MFKSILLVGFSVSLLVAGCGTARDAETLPLPAMRFTLVVQLPDVAYMPGEIVAIINQTAVIRSVEFPGIRRMHITYDIRYENDHARLLDKIAELPGVRIITETRG